MPFRVMLVGSHKDNPVWAINPDTMEPYEYDTGSSAQERAKILAQGSDAKWRVKRIVDTRWRSREARKFENGTYSHLPWHGSAWWTDTSVFEIHKHHYAHPSRKEPGMIAFTENADKGMENIRTRMKVGRYLEKYFGEQLQRWGINVKQLIATFESRYKPRTVLFAATEDEIQDVYERGPTSCMSSVAHRKRAGWGYPAPGQWPLDTHACRIYAFGDLQVAYITSDDQPASAIMARSVVWPEKKTHSRVYGTGPISEVTLTDNLRRLGYNHQAPYGAKVKRVEVPDTNRFLVPYIDMGEGPGGGATAVKDCKTHLEIVALEPKSYPANSTSGLSGHKVGRNLRPMANSVENCQRCDEQVDNTESGELYPVFTSGAANDFLMWCDECLDYGARHPADIERGCYLCGYLGSWYRATIPQRKMASGHVWSDVAFRQYGFRCAATGDLYHRDSRVVMYNGDLWNYDYFQTHGFTCRWSGDHFPFDAGTKTKSGHWIATIHVPLHTFTCESCSSLEMIGNRYPGNFCLTCHSKYRSTLAAVVNHRVPHIEEDYQYERVAER